MECCLLHCGIPLLIPHVQHFSRVCVCLRTSSDKQSLPSEPRGRLRKSLEDDYHSQLAVVVSWNEEGGGQRDGKQSQSET